MNGVLLALHAPVAGNGNGNGRPRRRDDWPMGDRWDMHDGGLGWAGWLLLLLLALLLVAVVVGVVLLLVRGTGGRGGGTTEPAGLAGGPGRSAPSAAEQVLDERFARGEIDEQEYLARRSVLRRE